MADINLDDLNPQAVLEKVFGKRAADNIVAEQAKQSVEALNKQVAEGIVSDQARSAAKSAETLAPKELPALYESGGLPATTPQPIAPVSSSKGLVPTMSEAGGDLVGDAYSAAREVPNLARSNNLPAVIEKAAQISPAEANEKFYNNLFGKFADYLPAQSGKSAAESAQTLVPGGKSPAASLGKLVSGGFKAAEAIPRIASKAALPLTVLQEALASPNVDEDEDATMRNLRAAGGDPVNPGNTPLPYGGLVGPSLEAKAKETMPEFSMGPEEEVDLNALGNKEDESPEDKEKSRILANLIKLNKNYKAPKMAVADSIKALLQGNREDMANAMQSRNTMQLLGLMGKAGNQIGASIAGVKPNSEVYDQIVGQAGQPIQDLSTQQQMETNTLKAAALKQETEKQISRNDPNSRESQSFRKSVESVYPGIAKTYGADWNLVSAADKELIWEPIKLKEQLDMKKLQIEANMLQKKILHTTAANKEIIKRGINMGQDMDPNRARTGEMGKNQARVNAADRIDALITQFPDYNIPKIQTRELAASVAGLLQNGGQTAIHQINELTPDTVRGNAEDIASWLTGDPRGRQQQAFMKLFHETARREKEVAQHQMNEGWFQKAYGTHGALKNDDPTTFYRNLSTATHLPIDALKEIEANPKFQGNYIAPKATTQFPKQVKKQGQIATVSSQKELDEANHEGWQ